MKPILVGHRGFPAKYPENTIASFLAALYYGADGIELDVWLDRDGDLVVIHDPDTERVAGKKLVVKESSTAELKSLDLGLAQRIPLLEEVLKALPSSIPLFVEIKDVEASIPAYELIERYNRLDNTMFISFHPEALEKIRMKSSVAKLGFIIGNLEAAEKAPELAMKLKLQAIAPPVQGAKYIGKEKFIEYLKKIKEMGLYTAVWVVNTEEEYKLVKDIVDAIITDNIEYIRKLHG
ncbi:MAG: glycerophosphodiester phosphodiesterase [Crenarchaeota archaeon]|nr:glycerophosphodiester phosphodiesterase [Thermoproteota archaeon]